jgi:hypothetical protein
MADWLGASFVHSLMLNSKRWFGFDGFRRGIPWGFSRRARTTTGPARQLGLFTVVGDVPLLRRMPSTSTRSVSTSAPDQTYHLANMPRFRATFRLGASRSRAFTTNFVPTYLGALGVHGQLALS